MGMETSCPFVKGGYSYLSYNKGDLFKICGDRDDYWLANSVGDLKMGWVCKRNFVSNLTLYRRALDQAVDR